MTASIQSRRHLGGRIPIFSLMSFSLFVCLIILCSGCGESSTQSSQSNGPWPGPLAVTFRSSISYEAALRLVTDLGLQPALSCGLSSSTIAGKSSSSYPHRKWIPVGQKDSFAQNHQLLIITGDPTTNWWKQLNAAPEVNKVGFLDPPKYVCQNDVLFQGTPPANTPLPLSSRGPLQYARITFRHEVGYDKALYLISNEGLYLANPCSNQDVQGGQKEASSRGQEANFASKSILVVATQHGITSSFWQQQLKKMPEILSMTVFSQC